MLNKNTMILVLVLVAGAAATLLIDKKGTTPVSKSVGHNVFDSVNMAKIKDISLKNGEKSLSLKMNTSGNWAISSDEGFPANADKVVKLFESLSDAKIVRHVNTSKSTWDKLELSANKQVILSGDDYKFTIFLGKNRVKGGQYIALNDKEDSFLVDTMLTPDMDKESWWYKTLMDVDKEKIKAVTFSENLSFSRDKKDEAFKLSSMTDKEKLKESEVKRLDSLISSLTFTDKSKRTDAYNKALDIAKVVEFTTFDNVKVKVKVASTETVKPNTDKDAEGKPKDPEKETHYFIKVESAHPDYKSLTNLMEVWQFEVSEYVANNFIKQRSDFVEAAKS